VEAVASFTTRLELPAIGSLCKKCEIFDNTRIASNPVRHHPAYVKCLRKIAVVILAGWTGILCAEEIPDASCMDCHADKDLWKTNTSGRGMSLFVDLEKLKASSHKTNSCASCHADLTDKHPDDGVAPKPIDGTRCHKNPSETYGESVHGIAMVNGNAGAPNCSDCHNGHSILPPTSPNSRLHYSRLAETCGACHEQEAKDVHESVHGEALAMGYREAPTCTDCHSEHKIERLSAGSSRSSANICSSCHASERINTKFKMPSNRVSTFFDSYHGLAGKYGSATAANCSSCHGVHKILPSSNTNSTIHASNLAETCGKCHPGATENFAQSRIHMDSATAGEDGDLASAANFWVRRIYLILIFGTIGFMALHNGVSFVKKVRAKYEAAHLTIPRMSVSQRLQHMILALSFIWLAISGFALKCPDSCFAKLMGSSEAFRSWSHRIAGVMLLVSGAYHIYYVLAKRDGRKLVKDLLPAPKDTKDLADNVKYLSGLSQEKAKIGRFGYAEKMEYWAVVWGTIIMGVTGLMIWFKVDVTRFMPRWIVDVALTIHYYEAILACLAIIVWHFYHVMFDPDVYPLNWACVNGKVSKHWHDDEHPLEELPGESKCEATDQQPARK
jgi:formate dehydrogenase gamma subunit